MAEKPKWFQKFFYQESILAIKSSLDFLNFESFKNDLILLLPQESKKSKIRIANNIVHRFFPDKKIYGFLPHIWQIYQDELLLQELMRYELLNQEPVIADFVANNVLNRPVGSKFESQVINNYIQDVYGKEIKNLIWWLQSALRDLGFISKSGNSWQINDFRTPEAGFILLLHRIFAPYPKKIDFNMILEDNFWKFLGIRDIETLKNILYKAYLLNLIEYKDDVIKTIHSLENLPAILKESLARVN